MTHYATPPEDHPTRAEVDADEAGQPPPTPLTPKARAALVAAVVALQERERAVSECPDCGTRCEICDERMCATWGPEPAITCPAHPTCRDCDTENPCRECAAARREAAA